ncbi:unnamed protein product [Amoebophrya sp. A25]|nr:unnamed protein product [Amoebophrya sp. A25]|eukprot:GSA25T00010725001.1
MPSMQQCQGYVKFFSEAKGFGFISIEGGTDIFVAAKDVAGNPLYQDDLVTFDIEENKKGKAAKNVKGGTGNPFKGKNKGLGKDKGKGKGKGMKGGMKGGGKGGKGYGEEEEEDEGIYGGKANNGKGILPGGNHDWVKGKEGAGPFAGAGKDGKGGFEPGKGFDGVPMGGPQGMPPHFDQGPPMQMGGPQMNKGTGFPLNYAAPEFRPQVMG